MPDEPAAADIVIVGGGFSGTMLAAQLARRGLSSALIEGGGREGRGTAYSTPEDAHLLNVVAERMGAWADRPGDFAEAVAAEGHAADAFVPRRRYGEYLSNILHAAEASGLVRVMRTDAVAADRSGDGWRVHLADGSTAEGRALAVAHGNEAPALPPLARAIPPERFVNDPWSEAGRHAIRRAAASGGDVLIIGTGLTMIDVVLSLDEARHRGRTIAVSRRGLAPRAHADHDAAPVALDELPQGSVVGLWRWLRRRGAEVGWRSALDSLRPHSHALWQALGNQEQRRFLRHARPWWDVHRHRIAPEIAGRIRRLVQLGQLEIVAGRITDLWTADQKLGVAIRRRWKAQAVDQQFELVVNCTGPMGSISATGDGLLRSLFDQGLARPDALDLGLEVDGRSRLAGAECAWALGPLTKGAFWEITAVPDIRGQVARVADDISQELGR